MPDGGQPPEQGNSTPPADSPAPDAQPLRTIVLAAGEGKRMRSAVPKVLHPLAGRPLLEHAVRAAAGLDPADLVVVIGHGREAVGEHLDGLAKRLGRPLTTAVQTEQLGTGHAVGCALAELPSDLSGTVVVSYGDVPLLDAATLTELRAAHVAEGNAVTVLTAEVADPTGYGRVLRDADGAVAGIVEHKDADERQRAITEVNSGVYAFDAQTLKAALSRVSTANAQGEQYLTDVLGIARADGQRVGALTCTDPWQVEGVNDRAQLAALGAELNRRLVRHWMYAGVTFVDPASTWLDADVALAPDVLIEPGVQLRGGTAVAEGATIGPDTTLTDVRVGAAATVVRTHGSASDIGARASVGPFAYLRPGTKLGERGKIGTFVEVKKSDIGDGSKVPHLSYIGDARIGEHSNIGAGSITANHDGTNKNQTVIGSYARTSCDNTFVAPVTVHDGAYTGAGTVVRRDVPPGALAVSGGPQRNIDGWVVRRRPGTPAAEAAERAIAASAGESETSGSQDDSEGREQ
ncbi:bifunctional UDP-N-acetylglucosamine pyrophosphorylase/glucosamine-1-phosphate N-acetyltransferase [Tamaricihabitans halophyticus]|uniref:Bifunctional protein GlmU n=1 Tax=Tamaricihabitans halophyticus TaxID=1262583 RepID=A0A4R2RAC4_9PSEU|nr:bifunctional UDP-N-acetylglucosamine diphosphorylase/glucosamine-1-phosphate N-acetyltransferase GlmU [Tamaricihabitans halophyticus]TCP56365.1 bifunctional UDP-N-acetylglucosamine pyrophosphorylase/glucosamine-1-phosphate N-acetyltransferase [Tamaricihabitans halophyticus]